MLGPSSAKFPAEGPLFSSPHAWGRGSWAAQVVKGDPVPTGEGMGEVEGGCA